MDAFRAESVRLALQKMVKGSCFSICTVRTCLQVAGIVPPTDDLKALEPLHCVDWSDMTPEMRAEVMGRTLALFQYPEFSIEDLDAPLLGGAPGEHSSLFRRLIGRGADA